MGPILSVNSAIDWSQAQDAKGLCAGPATLPRKKLHATETLTNEQDAGRRIKTSQETGPMTDDSQTRKGANISRVDMLRTKTTRRVGCWNLRTLYQTGKLAQVIKEMQSYKIEILGVSETRWTGSESRQLLSGHHHSRGVGRGSSPPKRFTNVC